MWQLETGYTNTTVHSNKCSARSRTMAATPNGNMAIAAAAGFVGKRQRLQRQLDDMVHSSEPLNVKDMEVLIDQINDCKPNNSFS